MKFEITGKISQHCRLNPDEGEFLWASKGSLMSYSSGINWRLKVPGGLGGAVSRSFSGESLALTYVECEGSDQFVLLSDSSPGHIEVWDIDKEGVLATRGAFLGAWGDDVHIDVTIAKRAGAAFFGGAGLFLQKISGSGTALIKGSGDFVDVQLAEGESITVSTGNLAAFSETVDYDISGVGGIRKALFGGEGLFVTKLTGPGRVLLQTLKRTYGKNPG